MKNIVLILLLVTICPITVICQNSEIGTVVYVDSAATPFYDKNVISYNEDAQIAFLKSRQGKFNVKYIDNFFMIEGVKRSMRMVLDAWEDRLCIDVPIHFTMNANEDFDPSLEIKTTVAYASDGRNAFPLSLFAQMRNKEEANTYDTITINALTNWKTSWENDGTQWGRDNLQTALLRHIAHVLGFGTSIVQRAGGLGFAVRRLASPFDNLVSNGQKTLGSLSVRGTPTIISDFLKEPIFLKTAQSAYKLFSVETEYIPYRSGNYFSLDRENIMNYPYGDRSMLLPINDETLDVMSAIGWNVYPHDIHIVGNTTDVLGYGSLYSEHTFYAENAFGISSKGDWIYQIYDNNTHTYVDKKYGQGTSFIMTPDDEGLSYMDEFMCLQARIVFNVNGKSYTYPLTLDARPQFVNYNISNMQQSINSDYYSFDITISSRGATGGDIIVSSDYGTLCTLTLDDQEKQTIHVPNALKIGNTYLYINLTNIYGTTTNYITIDPQLIRMQEKDNVQETNALLLTNTEDLFDVYTVQGVLVGKNKRPCNLNKGTYILKNVTSPWKCRKIILR